MFNYKDKIDIEFVFFEYFDLFVFFVLERIVFVIKFVVNKGY